MLSKSTARRLYYRTRSDLDFEQSDAPFRRRQFRSTDSLRTFLHRWLLNPFSARPLSVLFPLLFSPFPFAPGPDYVRDGLQSLLKLGQLSLQSNGSCAMCTRSQRQKHPQQRANLGCSRTRGQIRFNHSELQQVSRATHFETLAALSRESS